MKELIKACAAYVSSFDEFANIKAIANETRVTPPHDNYISRVHAGTLKKEITPLASQANELFVPMFIGAFRDIPKQDVLTSCFAGKDLFAESSHFYSFRDYKTNIGFDIFKDNEKDRFAIVTTIVKA